MLGPTSYRSHVEVPSQSKAMRSLSHLLWICNVADAFDNGLGLTPPMGWRHWKAFYANIDQATLERMQDEMVKKYPVDGVPTSLKDLGYLYVGLDDHWQNCTSVCPNGTVVPSSAHKPYDTWSECCHGADGKCVDGSRTLPWYDADGTPSWDLTRFPDVKGMVNRAHDFGLRMGWYFGNFQCSAGGNPDHTFDMNKLAAGSVKAIKDYGFDSVKLDSGFPVASNMTLWAELINATGRPIMVENCHQGAMGPEMDDKNAKCTGLTNVSDCPYNFWRTTGDPYPYWNDIMRALNSLRKVENTNYPDAKRAGAPEYNGDIPLSRPGAWAYPNTMTVGDGSLTENENRVHFGGWCIVSSPLILAYDLSDPSRRELVWDIITNKEAIQVNQIWDGHPGRQMLANVGSNRAVEVWTKPVGEGRTAVFVINTADKNELSEPPLKQQVGLDECDAADQDEGQQWELTFDEANKTFVMKSSAVGSCLEIRGCKTTEHATVDTDYGCKALPAPGESCANMAWNFNSNGTITSVMSGKCLDVSSRHVEVNSCNGSSTQRWEVFSFVPGRHRIREADGQRRCLVDAPPKPVTVTIKLSDLGIKGETKVRDVWQKKDLPSTSDSITTGVDHHGSQFFVLSPPVAEWPIPFELAPWMKDPVNEFPAII